MLMLVAVEMFVCMGKEAVRFVKHLAAIAAASVRIPEDEFMHRHLLSASTPAAGVGAGGEF